MHTFKFRWISSFVLLLTLSAAAYGAPRYTVTRLNGVANFVSNSGVVVGYIASPDDVRGFSYSGGGYTELGSLGGGFTNAYAVNQAGTIVGFSKLPSGLDRAFSYSGGTIKDLGILGGPDNNYSGANGVNNAGVVVGFAGTAPGSEHAFSYSGGVMRDLGTLGGGGSQAWAINDAGTIVGDAGTSTRYISHAFKYSGGNMVDLGTFGGGTFSTARAVNNANVVVGYAESATAVRAFMHDGSKMIDLGTLGGRDSFAYGINNFGTVVGVADLPTTGHVACIWDKGVVTDLNTLVDLPAGTLTFAVSINDLGQIIASSQSVSYLLTPSPESVSRLVNISTRSFAGSGASTQIAGFIISGSASRRVLIRAGGPYLTQYGVDSVLGDPVLSLYEGSTQIATNDDWGVDGTAVADATLKVGSVSFPANSKDAAIVALLRPGFPYTAIVTGKANSTGNALIEVLDADDGNASSMVNISTRSFVGTGSSVQIAGFILRGAFPRKVLIRAGGPYLRQYGVDNILDDPALTIFQGSSQIAQNDDWTSNKSDVDAACKAVGAVGYAGGSKDAASVLILGPDQPYTAIVAGKNGGSGNAIVEVFVLP